MEGAMIESLNAGWHRQGEPQRRCHNGNRYPDLLTGLESVEHSYTFLDRHQKLRYSWVIDFDSTGQLKGLKR